MHSQEENKKFKQKKNDDDIIKIVVHCTVHRTVIQFAIDHELLWRHSFVGFYFARGINIMK